MKFYPSVYRFLIYTLFLVLAVAATAPAFAGDLVVTRYFSGLWDQPKQESQGIVLNIIDQEEDGMPKAVAYWFTYGDDLQTAWFMAIGHVEGDQVVMVLYTAYDVAFMEDNSPDVTHVDVMGDLILTFKNCNHGVASYEFEGGESGEFEIKRLAALYNSRCSGGISDNGSKGGKPLMLEVDLLPFVEGGAGEGKAKYWDRGDRFDFIVSAAGIPNGEYDIEVCGENEGSLMVEEGEGSTHFRSPVTEDTVNLTFEPEGCGVDILELGTETVVLTSGDDVLAEKETGKDKDHEDKVKVEAEFINTGVEGFLDAEGEAEYEVKMNSTEFEVEIEDVPAGLYGFFVAGFEEGQIEVLEDGGKGKLKFSDPQKDGWPLLDFVPWGQSMEVQQGGVAILTLEFPPE